MSLKSTGNAPQSNVVILKGSNVQVGSLYMEGMKTVAVGQNVSVNATGEVIMMSTGTCGNSKVKLRKKARIAWI